MVSEQFGPSGTAFSLITDFLLTCTANYNDWCIINFKSYAITYVGTYVYTRRGWCHSFKIFKEISRGRQILRGQNTTTEHIKEALRRRQAEPAGRTKKHGCPSAPPDDRWWSPCTAAPPSLTAGKTTLPQWGAWSPAGVYHCSVGSRWEKFSVPRGQQEAFSQEETPGMLS